MSKSQMNEIRDGIYFEKLSIILTNIQQWQKGKNNAIQDIYADSVFSIFSKLEKNSNDLNNQMNQFLKILNIQYSFLSKLKREAKNAEVSLFYKEFKDFSEMFGVVKESLLELNDYLGKFIGVTGYEFTELKRIHDEVEELKTRFDNYRNKLNSEFNQKKELIYSKKNVKKTFELMKIIEIVSNVAKQKSFYNDMSDKLYAILGREIEKKEKLYKDICDNLAFISKLYEKSFQKDILGDIRLYFAARLEKNIKNQKEEYEKCKLDRRVPEQAFKDIEEQFNQYFHQFLEEITITSWNISYAQKKKEDEANSPKEVNACLVLTFDYKLIFCEEEKKQVLLQINLQDLKIYKANVDGRFQVKNKKTKEKFYLRFPKVENQDQFFLHFQQIAQKA